MNPSDQLQSFLSFIDAVPMDQSIHPQYLEHKPSSDIYHALQLHPDTFSTLEGFSLPDSSSSGDSSGSDNNYSPGSPGSPNSITSDSSSPNSPNTEMFSSSIAPHTNFSSQVSANPPAKKPKRAYTKRKARSTPEPDASLAEAGDLPSSAILQLLEEADLKKKRLARKAELARISRKRKKMKLCDLEDEVNRLQAELDRVKKHRKADQELLVKQAQQLSDASWSATQPSKPVENNSTNELEAAIKAIVTASAKSNDQNEAVISKLVDDLVEVVKRREIAAKLHLQGLGESLVPCMPLRFLQWVMTQNDKFYSDPSGLWNSLFTQDLGVSAEQMNELNHFRMVVKGQQQFQTEVEAAHAKLNALLRQHLSHTSGNFAKLRSILSPQQVAKLFGWVERFGHICVKINL